MVRGAAGRAGVNFAVLNGSPAIRANLWHLFGPLLFLILKAVPPDLNQIAALQYPLGNRLSPDKRGTACGQQRLRAAHLDGGVLGLDSKILE